MPTAPVTGPAIQVQSYMGDFDDLGDHEFIGPYPTLDDARADAERLGSVAGMRGSYDLCPVETAVATVDPAAFAAVATFDQFEMALYGNEPEL